MEYFERQRQGDFFGVVGSNFSGLGIGGAYDVLIINKNDIIRMRLYLVFNLLPQLRASLVTPSRR